MGNCINDIAFLFPKKKCVYGLLNAENIEKMPEHVSALSTNFCAVYTEVIPFWNILITTEGWV